jgi:hypothetical protein
MAIERAEAIARMPNAFRQGQSVASFILEMRGKGLSYSTSAMYADWYAATNVLAVEGAMRHIRKDYYPTEKTMADVTWDLSKEYMYKVRVFSRLRVGEPLTERFVNILSDIPLTTAMIEEAVVEKWSEWEDYTKEAIEKVTAWTALHRVS